jgi:hypothetical protein
LQTITGWRRRRASELADDSGLEARGRALWRGIWLEAENLFSYRLNRRPDGEKDSLAAPPAGVDSPRKIRVPGGWYVQPLLGLSRENTWAF